MFKGFIVAAALVLSVLGVVKHFDAKHPNFETLIAETSVNIDNMCSGVVIGKDKILTASHCVEGVLKREMNKQYPDQSLEGFFYCVDCDSVVPDATVKVQVNGLWYIARIEKFDNDIDLAVLTVPGVRFDTWVELEPAIGAPRLGDRLWCIGNPGGILPDTITQGIFSAKDRENQLGTPRLWQYDCSIHGGNSGGMVLNDAGRLVAITVQGIIGRSGFGTNYSFGIPLEEVRKFVGAYLQ